MPFGLNPFRKHDHDFPSVVVPLAEAPAHIKPNPELEKTDRPDDKTDDKSLDRAPSSEAGVGPVPNYSSLTIEALRAEVESDVAASGKDTAYDRMFWCFPPCDDAIQNNQALESFESVI